MTTTMMDNFPAQLEPLALVRMFAKYGGIANLEVAEAYGLDPEAAADGIVAPIPDPDPRG